MNKILYFESTAGIFHVARDEMKRYYILFNDDVMGTYSDMVDAIESFVYESGFKILHPEMGYFFDTYDLGVPDDIDGWTPC